VDNKIRTSRKLVIIKKKTRILLTSQPQEQKSRALISGVFLFRFFFFLILDYSRLSATVSPNQKQRSYIAEKKDTYYNHGKTGHWANKYPEVSKYYIYKINKLYLRIIEVDTNNKKIGEVL
jgi:negative regulator of replication initiation